MPKINQTMKNTLSSDLAIRPEFLGGPTLLAPFVQNCACQRGMMMVSHVSQSLVLDHNEQPRVMTGYEKIVGDYEFSTCRLTQDIVVRRCLPKYNPSTYAQKAGAIIPSYTVIYVGEQDHQVHCMDILRYTYLHEGFGYFNKMLGIDNDMLYDGSYIEKGTKLTTSPSHRGNSYGMGFNANVVYMTEWGATEDAFVVSKSLAAKGENTAFQKVRLTITPETIPINLYGTNGTYKCFPSIGETVRKDGALIGVRRSNQSTFVQDMMPESLRTIEHTHDEIHRAPPGSQIVDVDVYINMDAVRKMKDKDISMYRQFFDLNECHQWQQNAILQAYQQLCEKEGLACSEEFNTRVVREATLSGSKDFIKGHVRLTDAREPIEFIMVEITYAYKRGITLGSKLTDRCGKQDN